MLLEIIVYILRTKNDEISYILWEIKQMFKCFKKYSRAIELVLAKIKYKENFHDFQFL